MPPHETRDPYRWYPDAIEEPPTKLWQIFRRMGPGLILAGSVVGSGELIATTVLGAENGYSLLWLILLSCAIKIVVQNELGRYTIGTGETSLAALNRIPGPRLGVSWVVWLWFVMVLAVLFPIGGMLGAIGEVLNTLFPAIAINAWMWIVSALTVALLAAGGYRLIEKCATWFVVAFTALTVSCVFLLVRRPEYFSWAAVWDGLQFDMPGGGLITAVTVFGATGVGASELAVYPYWCIEKGYARFVGPRDNTEAWANRARGWIRVMGVDVLNCMVIYTFATVAFYFLGAGVLFGTGVLPRGTAMVQMLSGMYTETLGRGSYYLFLTGAIAVFYSTVFAATAAHSRLLADFLGLLGLYDRDDYRVRLAWTRTAVVFLVVAPALAFVYFQEPVFMVKVGGTVQALLLPVLGFSVIYLRYVHVPKAIVPKGWITLALWASSALMAVMMGYWLVFETLAWIG